MYQSTIYINLYSWLVIDMLNIKLGLIFDSLSCSMIFIVSTISWLVHIHSLSYMSHDPYLSRFMSYLSLFTFFMLILITSNNFLQLFIG